MNEFKRLLWVLVVPAVVCCVLCNPASQDDGTQKTLRYFVRNDTTFTVDLHASANDGRRADFSIPAAGDVRVGHTDAVSGGDLEFFGFDTVKVLVGNEIVDIYLRADYDREPNILDPSDYEETRRTGDIVSLTYSLFGL